ncbi:hypothetical protein EV121DRAFT_296046 [Schizophyllum commune]
MASPNALARAWSTFGDATFAKKLSTPRERKPSMPSPTAMARMRSAAAARWAPDATAQRDLQKVNKDTINEALTALEKHSSLQTRGAKQLDAQCRRPVSSQATLPTQQRLALEVGSANIHCAPRVSLSQRVNNSQPRPGLTKNSKGTKYIATAQTPSHPRGGNVDVHPRQMWRAKGLRYAEAGKRCVSADANDACRRMRTMRVGEEQATFNQGSKRGEKLYSTKHESTGDDERIRRGDQKQADDETGNDEARNLTNDVGDEGTNVGDDANDFADDADDIDDCDDDELREEGYDESRSA